MRSFFADDYAQAKAGIIARMLDQLHVPKEHRFARADGTIMILSGKILDYDEATGQLIQNQSQDLVLLAA